LSTCLSWSSRRRPCPRGFATAAFTVKAKDPAPEQTLFVVGLNEGKFFGQDSAEEALKLLEHVAEHSPEYTLLFGLADKRLAELEEDHQVKKGRLTPSRELEGRRFCEMVPVLQAGMVDKRPRRAVGRSPYTDQSHVAWVLWKNPREAVNIYWAYWRRHQYKDIAQRKFWTKHFPASAPCYFEERAHIIAIRATEHITACRKQGLGSSSVLVVNNDIYDLVITHLGSFLGKDAPEKLGTQEFSRMLRDDADHLCTDVLDLTPLLVFTYGVFPFLIFHFFFLGGNYYLNKAGIIEAYIYGDASKRL